jgi:hypothetical protein
VFAGNTRPRELLVPWLALATPCTNDAGLEAAIVSVAVRFSVRVTAMIKKTTKRADPENRRKHEDFRQSSNKLRPGIILSS